MVKSGLKEETMSMSTQAQPHVSQYRLAAHLGMAFTLYSLMFWQGLSHVLKPENVSVNSTLNIFSSVCFFIISLQAFCVQQNATNVISFLESIQVFKQPFILTFCTPN